MIFLTPARPFAVPLPTMGWGGVGCAGEGMQVVGPTAKPERGNAATLLNTQFREMGKGLE